MGFTGKGVAIAAVAVILMGCSPRWPSGRFPDSLEVKRTLFKGGGGFGLRETCKAIVVELTEDAAIRITHLKKTKNGLELEPPAGWNNTPVAAGREPAFYKGAFGGCNNNGDRPLGDLPGWLARSGAFYRVVNGGEGVAIIVPRAKPAGFYYFG